MLLFLAFAVTATPVPCGPIVAFDAVADAAGTVWVVAAEPVDTLRVLRSDDLGATWTPWLSLYHAGVTKVATTVGIAASPLCIAALDTTDAGDVWLWRVGRDSPSASRVPVAVGPDTVDNISVTVDRDPAPYIYCLYVSERRPGRTGALARSPDFGETWGPRTEFWNCWQPFLTHTRGSVIHCAWRYALTGTEIHHAYNRHYGESRYWSTVRIVARGPARRFDPVIVQADTSDELNAAAWAFFTTAWRETTGRDVDYSVSPRNGDWWAVPMTFGNSFIEQWPADAGADLAGPGGVVGLLYFSGGLYPGGPYGLWWSAASARDPNYWTRPVPVSDRPVRTDIRPRIIYPSAAPGRLPIFFYAADSALWCSRLWRMAEPESADAGRLIEAPSGGLEFLCPATGRYTLVLYDAAGRVLARPFAGALAAGRHRFALPADLPGGPFFAVLRGPTGSERRKLAQLN